MFFLTSYTKAQFYNNSKITFLVRRKTIDIIFKIRRGVYATVNVYTLSNERLLLACSWEEFFNRLLNIEKPDKTLKKLQNKCPITFKALTTSKDMHFAYTDIGQGAIVIEMNAPNLSNNISDFLHKDVIEKAIELISFNLEIQEEIEEFCPFSTWKNDLQQLKELR